MEILDRQVDWSKVAFFKPEEFADPDFPGSWIYMAPETVYSLEDLRRATGWPIKTHNKYGVRGCVCVDPSGHSLGSRHYIDHPDGCSAVDWHFVTDADPRVQALRVLQSGFSGIGIYYDWLWGGKPLSVGFHTDHRKRPQVWKRENGRYIYLLK